MSTRQNTRSFSCYTSPMTTIIAIDPGYDRCGIAILSKSDQGKEELVFSTCFVTDRGQELTERVFAVGQEVERMIAAHSPTAMAIENVYFQNNQKTIIGVSEAKGVCKYVAGCHGLATTELTPLQIKVAITGNGHATKDQVAWMVPKLIDIDLEKKKEQAGGTSKGLDDEVDAIAVGLAYFAYEKDPKGLGLAG